MHPDEYEVMSRVEGDHWWYRSLRDCLERTLRTRDLSPPAGARVLDAGCGTGANLRLLRDLLRPRHLEGFDAADEALALAGAKVPEAELYRGDICAPEVRSAPFDLIVSLDVIYIPGVQRARDGLRTLVEALRPGGLFISDNMLWFGSVLEPEPREESTRGVVELTRMLYESDEFDNVMLPLRDGVTVSNYRG